MALKTDWKAGEKGLTGAVNDAATAVNDHETQLATRLSEAELNATYVRFVDQNGDPLPAGSITTIHVNTMTGDIDDITFEEV